MSDHIQKTIADLTDRLRTAEEQVISIKRMINELCKLGGAPEQFSPEELSHKQNVRTIRSDQFYGRKMAPVIREYLEMRKASGQGAAKFSEIYSALISGGYEFDTRNEEIAKASLRSAIGKNPIFHRLPNGDYGLTVWYPKAKKEKNGAIESEAKDDKPQDANLESQ